MLFLSVLHGLSFHYLRAFLVIELPAFLSSADRAGIAVEFHFTPALAMAACANSRGVAHLLPAFGLSPAAFLE